MTGSGNQAVGAQNVPPRGGQSPRKSRIFSYPTMGGMLHKKAMTSDRYRFLPAAAHVVPDRYRGIGSLKGSDYRQRARTAIYTFVNSMWYRFLPRHFALYIAVSACFIVTSALSLPRPSPDSLQLQSFLPLQSSRSHQAHRRARGFRVFLWYIYQQSNRLIAADSSHNIRFPQSIR